MSDAGDEDIGTRYAHNPLSLEGERTDSASWSRFRDRLFKNLFGRTGFVFSEREITLLKADYKRPAKDTVTITCISSEITATADEDDRPRSSLFLTPVDEDRWVLMRTPSLDPHAWREERLRELKAALQTQPDIICFGEFAYPPPPATEIDAQTGGFTEEFKAALAAYENEMKGFETDMKALIGRRRVFIFFGSFHCTETFSNVGIIYPWGTRESVDVGVKSPEDHGPNATSVPVPIRHRKRFPARSLGERIRVPSTREFDVYRLPFGRLAVLICSDIVDLNQFMAIARINQFPVSRIDFVLVPSFNHTSDAAKGDPLVSMCRELSYIASTTVIVVNANPDIADFPKTEIFCCGSDSTHLRNSPEGVRPVDSYNFVQRAHPGSGRKFDITTCRLRSRDLATLRSARAGAHKKTGAIVGPMSDAEV